MSRRFDRFAVILAAGILVSTMNNNVIVVMKGKERFEIARDGGSKVPADVKVGDKVTVHYRMTATDVEAKAAKAAKAPAKAKKAA